MPPEPETSRGSTPTGMAPRAEHALRETQAWVRQAVVGLNLCPFAKAPLARQQVRFVVCESDDPRVLLDALCVQMTALAAADPTAVETTLLIHPNALLDFADFNDFLGAAEAALEDLQLDGVLQVASFHPQYCFSGCATDDIGNATNRSPHPTLHLLREASVARAALAFPDAAAIFDVNIATLEALGQAGWASLMAQCRAEADAETSSAAVEPCSRPP